MRVFVTGGLGFIGHRLVKKLIDENFKVMVYDMVNNYMDPSKEDYYKILSIRLKYIGDKVEIIKGDIRDKLSLYETMQNFQPNMIVHLAAIPLATIADQHRESTIDINLNGTINVLEVASRIKSVKRIIYISSSMVYGDFVRIPVREIDYCNPINIYGATKLCGEILVKGFQKTFDISYTIIRPSAVNGPGASNNSVLQLFCQLALKGKPITIKGSGMSMIDFTHVDDVAQGILLSIKSHKAINQTLNITKGEGNSINELVGILKKLFSDLKVDYISAEKNIPERGSLDISKAKNLIGYTPKYSLKDCVTSYIKFYKEVLK